MCLKILKTFFTISKSLLILLLKCVVTAQKVRCAKTVNKRQDIKQNSTPLLNNNKKKQPSLSGDLINLGICSHDDPCLVNNKGE